MARDRPPSPRGRRWRGEPSAPSASRQPIFRGAHPERSGRALAFDGRELREHPRRFARRRVALGPASLPRDPRRGARPVRARRRLAVLRGRRTRRVGLRRRRTRRPRPHRRGGGDTPSRARACARRRGDWKRSDSCSAPCWRRSAPPIARWRERAASEAAAGGDPSRGFPAVIHTTQGTLLDRRFLVGLGTGSNPGGGGV